MSGNKRKYTTQAGTTLEVVDSTAETQTMAVDELTAALERMAQGNGATESNEVVAEAPAADPESFAEAIQTADHEPDVTADLADVSEQAAAPDVAVQLDAVDDAPAPNVQGELLPPPKISQDQEDELLHAIEAVLFAAGEPMTLNDLKKVFERLWDDADGILPEHRVALSDGLKTAYKRLVVLAKDEAHEVRGFSLLQVADGLTFRSNPRYAHVLRAMREEKPVRLSQAALETLAIVAYRQPVTKPETDHIRGVDCGGTLRLLLDRNLIRIVGKKDEPGRPMLYGTTREFLSFFNLGNLAQLPTLREFHELNPDSQEELQAFEQTMPSFAELSENAKKLRLDEEPAVTALDEAVLALGNQEQTAKAALLAEGIAIEDSEAPSLPVTPQADAKVDETKRRARSEADAS